MQENNFEGKVHDIMEGFTVNPSEKVWDNIQADMAGRKKNRFGMVPAVLLTGCFLLATFFLHDLEKRHPVAGPPASSGINATVQSAITIPADLKKKTTAISAQKNTIQPTVSKDLNEAGLHETKYLVTTRKNKINHLTKTATAVDSEKEINKIKDEVEIEQVKGAIKLATAEVATTNENKKNSVLQTIPAQIDPVKINDVAVQENKEKESPNKTIVTKKEKNKGKWDFFIAVTAGRFSTGNSYLGQTANSDYYNSQDALNNNGSSSSSSFKPSLVKPGFSFSTVVKASRKFSSKTAIALGLGYQYAGTSITTGQMLSGSSRDNFAIGNANEFHNQYQFIQIPLEIQSMIGKGKKLPLYWNAGFAFSRLISADVLQFDRTQGRYFKDNSYLNKNTIGVSAGLSLAILKKQQTQWLIGPQFYYSLTPVAGKGLYDKTHYSFLGLQIQKKL